MVAPAGALNFGVKCRTTSLPSERTEGDATEGAAESIDDAAALAFACEIVRELAQSL
jgi:hypothetical protein